ncbi:MAG: signal peptide peptidase SppA [Cyanobacteria bacterium SZAS LIN-2]|nr:signal peptide peptidase SppA [Cyanobacteria bacterium SZAS LIN-2]
MRINQRWFVWIVLALCVLAVPTAVFTQNLNKESDAKSGSNSGSGASEGFFGMALKDRIEVVKLSGMIIDKADAGVFSSSAGSSSSVLKELRKALANDKIKGVLLRVNSPGGTVPTSQEIHQAVTALRKKGKPVVVSMGDVAASGGYYVACAADRVVANPGTLTGSIGVIINLINFKGLADKFGVLPAVIKSGEFKDIASPYRPMTPAEHEILQTLIMDSYDQFTTAVSEGRKLPIETVKKIADGRIYSGRQALKLGLVDELGSYTDALASLQKLCKERYSLSTDLPVHEKGSDDILASLIESKSLLAPSSQEATLELIPTSLLPKLNKQPLWLMQ